MSYYDREWYKEGQNVDATSRKTVKMKPRRNGSFCLILFIIAVFFILLNNFNLSNFDPFRLPIVSLETYITNSKFEKMLGQDFAAITLIFNYDTKTTSWSGDQYQLRRNGNICTFSYLGEDGELYCDFSLDKWDELKSLILNSKIQEYYLYADSNGKIIYNTEETFLMIYDSKECKNIGITINDNVNEVIYFFLAMKALI